MAQEQLNSIYSNEQTIPVRSRVTPSKYGKSAHQSTQNLDLSVLRNERLFAGYESKHSSQVLLETINNSLERSIDSEGDMKNQLGATTNISNILTAAK